MSAALINSPPPSDWVKRHAGLIRPGNKVLDLACGSGRHTRLLHALGHTVIAADRDLSGVADLKSINDIELRQIDLETPLWPFAEESFAGIVVTNYLYRPHLQALAACLDDDGVLIYATFAAGHEAFGHPHNPDFLLLPDELLDTFGKLLHIVAYEQVTSHKPRSAVRQRICAVGTAHPASKG